MNSPFIVNSQTNNVSQFIDYDYIIPSLRGIKKSINVEPYHIPMLLVHLLNKNPLYITPCTDGIKTQLHSKTHIFETEKINDTYYVVDLVRSHLFLNDSIETRLSIAQKITDTKIVHCIKISDSFNMLNTTINKIIMHDEKINETVHVKPLIKLMINSISDSFFDKITDEITYLFDILLQNPKTPYPSTGWNVYTTNLNCIKFKSLDNLTVDLQFIDHHLCAMNSNIPDPIFEENQILNEYNCELINGSIYQCIPKLTTGTNKWIADIVKNQKKKLPTCTSEVNSTMQRIKMNWTPMQLIDVFVANNHIYNNPRLELELSSDIEKCQKIIFETVDLNNKNILDLNIVNGSKCNYLKNISKYCSICVNPITLGLDACANNQNNQYLIWGNIANYWNQGQKDNLEGLEGLEGIEYFTDYETTGLFKDIDIIMCVDMIYDTKIQDIDNMCNLIEKSRPIKLIICDFFSKGECEKEIMTTNMTVNHCIECIEYYGWKFETEIEPIKSDFTKKYLCLIFNK